MKFTTEEIALCKKIAEKHRVEAREGSYLFYINKSFLVTHVTGSWIYMILNGAESNISATLDSRDTWFPLWQISDCLEFLIERSFYVQLEYYGSKWQGKIYKSDCQGYPNYKQSGKTPFEACLKAVLAIVEEG